MPPSGTVNKRKRRNTTSKEEDETTKKSRGINRRPSKDANYPRPFACPYYKKDPLQRRKCSNFETKRISHLKQHVKRTHQQAPYCPTCGATFQDTASCNNHIRGRTCQVSTCVVEPDGITQEQCDALSRRVPSVSNMSREQQWFCVFDTVCPGHQPRPVSPYSEPAMCESPLALIRQWGLQIFIASLRQEDQRQSTLDLSVFEPVLGRVWTHTFKHFATGRPGSEALEDRDEAETSDSSLNAGPSHPIASRLGHVRSAEACGSFPRVQVSQHPVASGLYEDPRLKLPRYAAEDQGHDAENLLMLDDCDFFSTGLSSVQEMSQTRLDTSSFGDFGLLAGAGLQGRDVGTLDSNNAT